eukprot:2430748-Amphidinium_carterae.1
MSVVRLVSWGGPTPRMAISIAKIVGTRLKRRTGNKSEVAQPKGLSSVLLQHALACIRAVEVHSFGNCVIWLNFKDEVVVRIPVLHGSLKMLRTRWHGAPPAQLCPT